MHSHVKSLIKLYMKNIHHYNVQDQDPLGKKVFQVLLLDETKILVHGDNR